MQGRPFVAVRKLVQHSTTKGYALYIGLHSALDVLYNRLAHAACWPLQGAVTTNGCVWRDIITIVGADGPKGSHSASSVDWMNKDVDAPQSAPYMK